MFVMTVVVYSGIRQSLSVLRLGLTTVWIARAVGATTTARDHAGVADLKPQLPLLSDELDCIASVLRREEADRNARIAQRASSTASPSIPANVRRPLCSSPHPRDNQYPAAPFSAAPSGAGLPETSIAGSSFCTPGKKQHDARPRSRIPKLPIQAQIHLRNATAQEHLAPFRRYAYPGYGPSYTLPYD